MSATLVLDLIGYFFLAGWACKRLEQEMKFSHTKWDLGSSKGTSSFHAFCHMIQFLPLAMQCNWVLFLVNKVLLHLSCDGSVAQWLCVLLYNTLKTLSSSIMITKCSVEINICGYDITGWQETVPFNIVTFKEGEIGQQQPVASYMNAFKSLSTKNVVYFVFQSSALYAWWWSNDQNGTV